MSYKVHLFPGDKTVELNGVESLLLELKNQGIELKSSCGGCASCGDCVIKVKEGATSLTEQTFEEKRLLGNVFHITKERLACQTKVRGDLSIDITAHVGDNLSPSAPVKSKNVLIRKKETIEKQKAEAEKPKDVKWFKHWEKEEKDNNEVKKLGGNKRPKPFTYNDDK